jgi:hypothetical protein
MNLLRSLMIPEVSVHLGSSKAVRERLPNGDTVIGEVQRFGRRLCVDRHVPLFAVRPSRHRGERSLAAFLVLEMDVAAAEPTSRFPGGTVPVYTYCTADTPL